MNVKVTPRIRVRSLGDVDQDRKSNITPIMVHQRNRGVSDKRGFIGLFDAT